MTGWILKEGDGGGEGEGKEEEEEGRGRKKKEEKEEGKRKEIANTQRNQGCIVKLNDKERPDKKCSKKRGEMVQERITRSNENQFHQPSIYFQI